MLSTVMPSLALLGVVSAQYYSATYTPSASGLPQTTEDGQAGVNDCGTANSQTSMCQNFYINDITDFCVWAPPNGGAVAEFEATEVSYCTKAGRGTRLIPEGTVLGAHFVKTPSYVQVTGTGDFTKIGITPNDDGGELDPHGATGVGNPVGGLVFHNGVQMHEWFSFMSATEFCIRACYDGDRATSLCRHTYDVLGCGFNAPGNYAANVFETCDGNDAQDIMYGYPGLNSFAQDDTLNGVAVPSPHPAPPSSQCVTTSAAALGGTAAGFANPTPTSTPMSSSSTSSTSSTSASTTSAANSTTTSLIPSSTMTMTALTSSMTTNAPGFSLSLITTTGDSERQQAATGNEGVNSSGSVSSIIPYSLALALSALALLATI